MTPTPTIAPTVTPIPAITLDMSQVITVTAQLGQDQLVLFSDSQTAPAFLGLAALILVFGLLMFIKALLQWRRHDS
jgi:hypothetical protein